MGGLPIREAPPGQPAAVAPAGRDAHSS